MSYRENALKQLLLPYESRDSTVFEIFKLHYHKDLTTFYERVKDSSHIYDLIALHEVFTPFTVMPNQTLTDRIWNFLILFV